MNDDDNNINQLQAAISQKFSQNSPNHLLVSFGISQVTIIQAFQSIAFLCYIIHFPVLLTIPKSQIVVAVSKITGISSCNVYKFSLLNLLINFTHITSINDDKFLLYV